MSSIAKYASWCATTLCTVSIASAVDAQAASPQALVVKLWTEFDRICVPYLANPEATLLQPSQEHPEYQEFKTPGGAFVLRHGADISDYENAWSVEVHVGEQTASVGCEVSRTGDLQPFRPSALENALRQLTSQLPGVLVTGGKVAQAKTNGASTANGNPFSSTEEFSVYVIENALPGRLDLIEVEISESLFTMYVAANLGREDWK